MEKFEPGDIAICIFTGKFSNSLTIGDIPPLTINNEYIVFGVENCLTCGIQAIDVGIKNPFANGTRCYCGVHYTDDSVWWCDARRFKKKPVDLDEEIIVEEEKELAI